MQRLKKGRACITDLRSRGTGSCHVQLTPPRPFHAFRNNMVHPGGKLLSAGAGLEVEEKCFSGLYCLFSSRAGDVELLKAGLSGCSCGRHHRLPKA